MSTDGPAGTGASAAVPDDPDQLRQEIERTREQLGETVEALVYKTDVKARAKDRAKERAEQLSQRVKGTTAQVKEQAAARTIQARAQATARAGQARSQIAGKTADARNAAVATGGPARDQLQARATAVGGAVRDKTPEPVQRAARQVAQRTSAVAGQRRGLAAAGRRGRRGRRGEHHRDPAEETEVIILKVLYKPFGIVVSVLGGVLAGAIFKRVWKLAGHEDEAPEATDAQRGWGEVLIAATLQGAIFALVKAATDRGAATVTRRLLGFWPGKEADAAE